MRPSNGRAGGRTRVFWPSPGQRQLVPLIYAVCVLQLAGAAHAQELKVVALGISHSSARSGALRINSLNYADCVADDVLSFPVTLSNVAPGDGLEVWAGTNCADATLRSSTSQQQCWKVLASAVPALGQYGNVVLPIHVRSMVSGYTLPSAIAGAGQVVQAGPEVCEVGSDGSARQVILTFLVTDAGANVLAAEVWPANFKLRAPPPPDLVSVAIGLASLSVHFGYSSVPADSGITGFRFYCDPAPGRATIDTQSGCTTPSSLMAGAPPPGGAEPCGELAPSAMGGTIAGLAAQPYQIAVLATDGFENVGKLSPLVCGIPTDSSSIATGRACSFSPARSRAQGALALLTGALLLWHSVRARSTRPQRGRS